MPYPVVSGIERSGLARVPVQGGVPVHPDGDERSNKLRTCSSVRLRLSASWSIRRRKFIRSDKEWQESVRLGEADAAVPLDGQREEIFIFLSRTCCVPLVTCPIGWTESLEGGRKEGKAHRDVTDYSRDERGEWGNKTDGGRIPRSYRLRPTPLRYEGPTDPNRWRRREEGWPAVTDYSCGDRRRGH